MKNQEIFILMDDSGKLNKNENSCIYGGLFFFSSNDYMNFINKYKSTINNIKCKYCNQLPPNCNNNCMEIKGITHIKNKDKRRIFNLVKKEKNFGVFIKNKKVYPSVLNDKSARGRFCDYAQKRIVKEIILYSITNNYIDPNNPLKIYIKSDESKTKSNGYYNLKDSIYEELVNGIINYDYSKIHHPILHNGLSITYKTYDSKYNFGIQSADIISHYMHSEYEKFLINGKDISSTTSFIEVKLFLP
ncbi:MAG: DUF3800 domain-containing protein [Ruminococcus sp.]|nr:DUF3800 domain-containing protein [Ruminococcus sp.]